MPTEHKQLMSEQSYTEMKLMEKKKKKKKTRTGVWLTCRVIKTCTEKKHTHIFHIIFMLHSVETLQMRKIMFVAVVEYCSIAAYIERTSKANRRVKTELIRKYFVYYLWWAMLFLLFAVKISIYCK
ncbi:hypothetical protein NL108_008785 [Boleophthalmus pectinirostris]|nr:hypothetical protein NL108_008785 [Boleophthalmus pectinirostris]